MKSSRARFASRIQTWTSAVSDEKWQHRYTVRNLKCSAFFSLLMGDSSDLETVLRCVLGEIQALGIRYHITGGLASSFYGEPRFTQDIDLVVSLEESALDRLVAGLEPEFLLDRERARRASEVGGLFQALHQGLLIKVDFHVGEGVPGELGRSRTVSLFPGLDVSLVSKEDAVLSKLVWVKQGSAKSKADIVGMLLDTTPLDTDFVAAKCAELECSELWIEMQQAADAVRTPN